MIRSTVAEAKLCCCAAGGDRIVPLPSRRSLAPDVLITEQARHHRNDDEATADGTTHHRINDEETVNNT
jgi:hypothetical protein